MKQINSNKTRTDNSHDKHCRNLSLTSLAVFSALLVSTPLYAQGPAQERAGHGAPIVAKQGSDNTAMAKEGGYRESGYWQSSGWQKNDWVVVYSDQPVSRVAPLVKAQPETARKTAPEPVMTSTTIAATDSTTTANSSHKQGLQVAQLGRSTAVIENDLDERQPLLDVLTADFSLDVYFRSGSSTVESFYPARLAAVAKMMQQLPQLEIHLDGYSDRRGDATANRKLAEQRIAEVRRQLIDAGIEDSRIVSTAFGEMKMVSAPGDLEGYSFDRKVVIRFERMAADSIHAMHHQLGKEKDAVTAGQQAEPKSQDTIARF